MLEVSLSGPFTRLFQVEAEVCKGWGEYTVKVSVPEGALPSKYGGPKLHWWVPIQFFQSVGRRVSVDAFAPFHVPVSIPCSLLSSSMFEQGNLPIRIEALDPPPECCPSQQRGA